MLRINLAIIALLLSDCLFGQCYVVDHYDNDFLTSVYSDMTEYICDYMGHHHIYPASKDDIISFLIHRYRDITPEYIQSIKAHTATIGLYGDCFLISNKNPKSNQSFLVVGYLEDWHMYHYYLFARVYQPAFFNSSGDYLWMPQRDDLLIPGQEDLNKQYDNPLRIKVFGVRCTDDGSAFVPYRLHCSYSKRQGIVLKKDYGVDMGQYAEYLKDLESLLNDYVKSHPEVDSIDFFSPMYSKKK